MLKFRQLGRTYQRARATLTILCTSIYQCVSSDQEEQAIVGKDKQWLITLNFLFKSRFMNLSLVLVAMIRSFRGVGIVIIILNIIKFLKTDVSALAEHFSSPANRISLLHTNTKIGNDIIKMMSSDQHQITYQPVMLRAKYELHTHKGAEFLGVEEPEGLGSLFPDEEINLPLFNKLKNNCDILITVTMYNEGVKETKKTLKGIVENLEAFKN